MTFRLGSKDPVLQNLFYIPIICSNSAVTSSNKLKKYSVSKQILAFFNVQINCSGDGEKLRKIMDLFWNFCLHMIRIQIRLVFDPIVHYHISVPLVLSYLFDKECRVSESFICIHYSYLCWYVVMAFLLMLMFFFIEEFWFFGCAR